MVLPVAGLKHAFDPLEPRLDSPASAGPPEARRGRERWMGDQQMPGGSVDDAWDAAPSRLYRSSVVETGRLKTPVTRSSWVAGHL